ncbi:MAG: carboxypeptidase-like regulatory domain-containing protein [Nanoarchaeota archaeon]|nr:carboxypeptidase-like regulatory domain-containing protein [Nanoarchaeota archaeon]
MKLEKRGIVWLFVVVIVALFFLVLVNHGRAQGLQIGCFTEPGYVFSNGACHDALPSAQAMQNCQNDQTCYDKYFYAGQPCSNVHICTVIPGWCTNSCLQVPNVAGCADRSKFISGGTSARPEICDLGCCVCTDGSSNVCKSTATSPIWDAETDASCDQKCGNLIGSYQVGLFNRTATSAECTAMCGGAVPDLNNISGKVVKNDQVTGIAGASVKAAGKATQTDNNGDYQFLNLASGTVRITASLLGYDEITIEENLTGGVKTVRDIVLPSITTGILYGTVTDGTSGLGGVLISMAGPKYFQDVTDANGDYRIDVIWPVNQQYTITVSKQSYQSVSKSITISAGAQPENFVLSTAPQGYIWGYVREGNVYLPQAQVWVDGSPVALTDGSGKFNVSVFANSTGKNYTVYVTKSGYSRSASQLINVKLNEHIRTDDFRMVSTVTACSHPQSPKPTSFTAHHVLGERRVRLTWTKPCDEVVGFYINRSEVGVANSEISLIYLHTFDRPQESFVDAGVEWGKQYEHKIWAFYNDEALRLSPPETTRITTGDAICEGKLWGSGSTTSFSQFCINQTLRMTCGNSNDLKIVQDSTSYFGDCSRHGNNYYCWGPRTIGSAAGLTECRQAACSTGWWPPMTRTLCYGTNNFCYWDWFSTSELCMPCSRVSSCFDYQKQDACVSNSCLGQTSCSWIPSQINGVGWCVEDNFEGTSHCADCSGSQTALGKSDGCTQTICSALGDCYSTIATRGGNTYQWCTSCSSQTKCSELTTLAECEGSVQRRFSTTPGAIVPSGDVCMLGTCKWDSNLGANGGCIKDGDIDTADDCSGFTGDTKDDCEEDNIAPVTRVLPEGYIGVGGSAGWVIFEATDDNTVTNVSYCIDLDNTCIPGVNLTYIGGRVSENLADSTALSEVYSPTVDSYYLRFRSMDEFFNLEEVKSRGIFVDLTGPTIFRPINYVLTEKITTGGQGNSDLDITIVLTEKANCSDSLVEVNNLYTGSAIPSSQINETWRVIYQNLPDGVYNYFVTCTDNLGNGDSANITGIVIDAVKSVNVIQPVGATNAGTTNNPLIFIVSTVNPGTCDLYQGSTPQEQPMQAGNVPTPPAQQQHTSLSYTLADGYYQNWRARCTTGSPPSTDTAWIPFTVDHQPPITNVRLTSNQITRTLSGNFVSEFNDDVTAVLICNDQPPHGFGCDPDKIYWCSPNTFGAVCNPQTQQSRTLIPTITQSKTICFKSIDNDNNAETASCGNIEIKPGIGVKVEEPSHGVSAVSSFNLTISTGISTSYCRFGFISTANFTTLTDPRNEFTKLTDFEHRINNFTENELIGNFPSSPDDSLRLYVACNLTNGQISLAEPIDLVYDPSRPSISLSTNPASPISEGDWLDIVVSSDDKTICKYSATATSYNDMQGTFPDYGTSPNYDDPIYRTGDREQIGISSDGTYTYHVACENEAELISLVKDITYEIDFTAQGTITQTAPSGSIQNQDVLLEVWTNKAANCSYAGSSEIYMTTTNSLYHSATENDLPEGIYSIPVRCRFAAAQATATNSISFKIDLTPPSMDEVDDGIYSCSLEEAHVEFTATDNLSSVTDFEYELLKKGTNDLLFTGNTTTTTVTVTGLNLSLGDNYYFKARAKDSAGNWGSYKNGDGFEATYENRSECIDQGPPTLNFVRNETSEGVRVSIDCDDETGCESISYGTASSAEDCNPTLTYQNIPILLTSTSYICAEASDSVGNEVNKTERVFVGDEDGDGVANAYDKCLGTRAGATVDADGCSNRQLNLDTDHDRLPDWWEIQNDYLDCLFDFQEQDSDNDGEDDDLEDYNNNGISNYDEFLAGDDPCAIDDSDNDGVPDHVDNCPNTPASEIGSIDDDVNSLNYGCGPSEISSLGDGIDDAWRERYFGCILCPEAAANADPDEDGLTNLEEYNLASRYGRSTNPTRKDTDFDGHDDKTEVDNNWDPTDANSPGEEEPSNFLAWLFLILGLLMAMAGIVIILIFKFKKPKARMPVRPVARPVVRPVMRPRPVPRPVRSARYEELVARRKAEREAARKSRISKAFGIFGGKKEPLPHLTKIVTKKEKSVFDRLTDATHHYMIGKDHVAPRLTRGEKNVFEELTKQIKKPTKTEVRKFLKTKPKQEVHEAFNKLVDMINKHGGGRNFDHLKKNVKKK